MSKSLEQLTGFGAGDAEDAPTDMIKAIILSWKKPLKELTDGEIGRLVIQHDGYPYILDLVWAKLLIDPLFDGGYYPGCVLSNLIRAKPEIWANRPQSRIDLEALYRRALNGAPDETSAFRDSLDLPESSAPPN